MKRLLPACLRRLVVGALLLAASPLPAQDGFDLRIGRIALGGHGLAGVHLACTDLRRDADGFSCRRGTLGARGQRWPLRFAVRAAGRLIELEIPGTPGEHWRLRRQADGSHELTLRGARLARLAGLLPALDGLAALAIDGRLDGRLHLSAGGVDGELRLTGGRFAKADGTQAGEALAGTLSVALRRRGDAWTGSATLDWQAGELYLAPFYLAGGGYRLALAGAFADGIAQLRSARLALAGGGTLAGSAVWRIGEALPRQAELQGDELDLGVLGERLVAPLLAARALPPAAIAGQAALRLVWRDGAARQARLVLRDATLGLADGRLALHGVNGDLDWSAESPRAAELRVGGGRIGDLPLGAFTLPLHLRPDGVDLKQASIPLLDGELLLDDWQLRRPATADGAWQWSAGLALTPLSLPALTQALGLPALAGTLSFSLPRLRHADGALVLDGAAVIQAFDGFLSVTGLRLADPFGPLPRLSGDIELRHVDLGMLTDAYSFGHITGYIDADIHGLEMAGLRPLAFDARIASSPGRYPRRISQRAVQNITALGGGTAALQRSFLGFFEDFGYERMALSCRLSGNVCVMGGLGDAAGGQGFRIVEGGGIPALSIVGYNRRVDWPELIERLRGAIRNNLKAEIR